MSCFEVATVEQDAAILVEHDCPAAVSQKICTSSCHRHPHATHLTHLPNKVNPLGKCIKTVIVDHLRVQQPGLAQLCSIINHLHFPCTRSAPSPFAMFNATAANHRRCMLHGGRQYHRAHTDLYLRGLLQPWSHHPCYPSGKTSFAISR